MASKLRAQQAPPAAVVAALLLAACLVLAATVADARPLKTGALSTEGGDAHRTTVVESPAGNIQTVVVGAAGQDGAGGHKLMNIDMLGGIKDSGPSPGAGH